MAGLMLHRKRQHLAVRWASDNDWLARNELGDLGQGRFTCMQGQFQRPTTLGFSEMCFDCE